MVLIKYSGNVSLQMAMLMMRFVSVPRNIKM